MYVKALPKFLLGTGLIVGLLGVISFGLFYFLRDDVAIQQVQPSDSQRQASRGEDYMRSYKIVVALPKDAIRAILEPEFISPVDAENQMTDNEQVIGVSINGDALAYPIYMLSSHEIVNDVVGGEHVAVTW